MIAVWLRRLVAPAVALSAAASCVAGTASSSFLVTITVVPTKQQELKNAEISVRQPNGSTVVLDPRQQAEYIADPDSIRKHLRASAGEPLQVTIRF